MINPPVPMPEVIWTILQARGLVSLEDIQNFVAPSLKNLTDPLMLSHMDLAVNRLKTAWEKKENICVYGDYDLDGSSGIALLVDGLEGLGFENVSFYQPSRFLEGYGIHKEALKVIREGGAQIVISVDCGITAVEEARYAKELGLDLLITDHHLPQDALPECVAVVNPNKGICPSGLGHLSGVGVGFYLIMALKRALNIQYDLKSLLDLFAIGTVTDMVPLVKENRVLLKHGLKVLSETKRPGLQALIQHLGLLGRDLEAQDIAFSIGPKLNALSRLEKGLRPLDVFMCQDLSLGQALATEVIKLNEERKQIQESLLQKILDKLTEEELKKPAIILAAEGHAGVVGLVSTKIFQQTGKPAFIVALGEEGEGVGSARGTEGSLLPQALAQASDSLECFGGHAQAAGFSLKTEKFEGFKAAILKHYESKSLTVTSKTPAFDTELSLEKLNEKVMDWLQKLGPFGMSNPQPLFLVRKPQISRIQWLKEVHLKVQFAVGAQVVEGIYFFAKSLNSLPEISKEVPLDFLVEPTWNHWRGQKRLQLLIRSISPSFLVGP